MSSRILESDLPANERASSLQTLDRALELFCEVSQLVTSMPPADFLKLVPDKTCAMLSAPVCILWELDKQTDKFKVIGTAGKVDKQYKRIELSLDEPNVQRLLAHRGAKALRNVTESPIYAHLAAAQSMGWVSLLSTPLRVGTDLVGLLDVYSYDERLFTTWEKNLLAAFASLAADSLQKAELLRENQYKLSDSRRLEKLTEVMLEMTEQRHVEDLLWQLLNASLSLVNQSRGSITRTDYKTGEQVIVEASEKRLKGRRLEFRKGIIGQAVAMARPVREDNVLQNQNYMMSWDDTRAELAIPILISNARVRIGHKIESKSKLIGVLNLESPQVGAFSESDENCLWVLARYAALVIERIEFDQKLEELRRIEKRIAGNRDFDQTIRLILEGIMDTLKYEMVNISLVVSENNSVETKYIEGLSEADAEEFKRMAKHSLGGNDIQARIVESRTIEVLDVGDARFDLAITRRFNLDQMVRVFIPMIGPASNQVIGTVEAGYQRQYRQYIYEQDIQVLKSFVEHAVQSLEQSKPGLIERFSHELKSPIVGIRSHVSLLQKRISILPGDLISNKFDDILADCDILLQQVRNLEFFLGRDSLSSGKNEGVEKTVVFRDIVMKALKQLKPLVKERGFEWSKVTWRSSDATKIIIWVNKATLSQVVFNLLANAIKYAEDDSKHFKLLVKADEDEKNFILSFADWGIGVRKELKEKVFDWGFRSPEAIDRNVSGTGVGLTIAREIMRGIGGDLKLVKNYKPTEFHLILPKKLQEAPK